MAAQQQTPQAARIPPDVPSDPSVSNTLTQYLRNFALWARQGFADSLRSHEAQPGLMLRAYDTPAGQNPKIFMLEINSAGVIRARAMPLGGPQ